MPDRVLTYRDKGYSEAVREAEEDPVKVVLLALYHELNSAEWAWRSGGEVVFGDVQSLLEDAREALGFEPL